MRLDYTLIMALVEQWRCGTHIFHLCGGEMTPTLQDVIKLTVLLIDGAPMIGHGWSINIYALCDRLL
jgi:hypothetical protein